KAWEILLNVQSTGTKGIPLHPLLTARPEIKQAMIVLVTSDRGLAGAYNTNIIRVAMRFAERLGKPVRYVTVGKKGRDSLIRIGQNVIAEFSHLPADPSVADIAPVSRLAIDEFLSGTVDAVFIAYTDFINTLTQHPVVLNWLPLLPYSTEDQVMAELLKDVPSVSAGKSDYEYEPNAAAILDEIVPRFTELQLYQAVLESQASEHSARMVAMRNASDNATQLIGDLTLVYNKARQASITAEILDIVGGAEALQASIDTLAEDILAQANGVSAVPAAAAVRAAPKKAGKDDLQVIEGIGPKMDSALRAAGIDTFEKLAHANEAEIKAAIEAAGLRFAPSMPTWPKQATFAARGDWDELDKYQSALTAGRED
ncbi:MAG: ATP synthase F1 subunit gamma, partial [Anaerolineae bacterium]|nr:ATP synthase F1 subunit gamma [Anaerolineae bacterium]